MACKDIVVHINDIIGTGNNFYIKTNEGVALYPNGVTTYPGFTSSGVTFSVPDTTTGIRFSNNSMTASVNVCMLVPGVPFGGGWILSSDGVGNGKIIGIFPSGRTSSTWIIAMNIATASTDAGYTDWRLPTSTEAGLVRDNLLSNLPNGFTFTTGVQYWTATETVVGGLTAIARDFNAVSGVSIAKNTQLIETRTVLVRDFINYIG